MIIVARVSFPKKNLSQAVKAYTSLKLLPVDIERGGPYFKTNEGEIEAITYYRFLPEAPSDPLKYVKERYESFETIKGFSGEIARWQSIDEAITRLTT